MKKTLGILVVALALLSACKSSKTATSAVSGNIENWIVAAALEDCGLGDGTQCLQVKRNGAMDYELVANSVAGFTYEPGFKYSLEVEVKTVKGVVQNKLITQLFKVESKQ